MPQQPVASVQNKFTKGLVTEFSGLSFPEDAATDCDNTTFTIVGDVIRRLGIDKETNGSFFSLTANQAKSSCVWKNVGSDGNLQLEVTQSGSILSFFSITASTVSSPLSSHKLASTVDLSGFIAVGGSFDNTLECQYTSGNGYLFVYHPSCDPIYCTYTSGTVSANAITVKTRDFAGVLENLAVNARPLSLTSEHQYNLLNQGWTQGSPWAAFSSSTFTPGTGSKVFIVAAGLTVTLGDFVNIVNNHDATPGSLPPVPAGTILMSGSVTAYSGTSLTINVVSFSNALGGSFYSDWQINPVGVGYINTWLSGVGNYPSNADVWWYFKTAAGVFTPATTVSNVTLGTGPAPKGHYTVDTFSQKRSLVSGVPSLTDVTTTVRPRTGCWFQGRVWYTGVDAAAAASGNANAYAWTENIYFSRIVETPVDFGSCYQTNDPTSETLFDLLPTDGGVITIQGCGSIYKLFPLQNALIVFAANGVWYLTGSQGIGFSANDYTIVKLSSVRCISSTSFVDVNGLPYFWNEDGIYSVEGAKQGTGLLNSPLHVNPLEVSPITVSTILQFYNKIPLSSKKYARGSYHPIDYTIQWLYRDKESTGIADRYSFNKILNYNTYNKAFFPYTVDNTTTSINAIDYVAGPGGLNTPESAFKYLCSSGNSFSFADEHDITYMDWASFTPIDYSSYFITGYQIRGQAQKMFFPGYVWVFSNSGNDFDTAYIFNSIWDYAISGDSGRWSVERHVEIPPVNYGIYYRRHKIRGHGLALQFKVQSVSGKNFDIIGWTSSDNVNTGI